MIGSKLDLAIVEFEKVIDYYNEIYCTEYRVSCYFDCVDSGNHNDVIENSIFMNIVIASDKEEDNIFNILNYTLGEIESVDINVIMEDDIFKEKKSFYTIYKRVRILKNIEKISD